MDHFGLWQVLVEHDWGAITGWEPGCRHPGPCARLCAMLESPERVNRSLLAFMA